MASRTAGVGWFAVGFLAGVGATLAAIIFATRPQPTHVSLPAPQAPAAPVVTYHAPKLPEASAAPPPVQPAAPVATPSAPSARTPVPDRQTQEDAAAAGMTSRAHPAG